MRFAVECCGKTVAEFDSQYSAELAVMVLRLGKHDPIIVDALASNE